MNDDLKLRVAVAVAEITAAGMVAENKYREQCGKGIAYGEGEFSKLLDSLEKVIKECEQPWTLPEEIWELETGDEQSLALFFALAGISVQPENEHRMPEEVYAIFKKGFQEFKERINRPAQEGGTKGT